MKIILEIDGYYCDACSCFRAVQDNKDRYALCMGFGQMLYLDEDEAYRCKECRASEEKLKSMEKKR